MKPIKYLFALVICVTLSNCSNVKEISIYEYIAIASKLNPEVYSSAIMTITSVSYKNETTKLEYHVVYDSRKKRWTCDEEGYERIAGHIYYTAYTMACNIKEMNYTSSKPYYTFYSDLSIKAKRSHYEGGKVTIYSVENTTYCFNGSGNISAIYMSTVAYVEGITEEDKEVWESNIGYKNGRNETSKTTIIDYKK